MLFKCVLYNILTVINFIRLFIRSVFHRGLKREWVKREYTYSFLCKKRRRKPLKTPSSSKSMRPHHYITFLEKGGFLWVEWIFGGFNVGLSWSFWWCCLGVEEVEWKYEGGGGLEVSKIVEGNVWKFSWNVFKMVVYVFLYWSFV